jgi:hypothetical protein
MTKIDGRGHPGDGGGHRPWPGTGQTARFRSDQQLDQPGHRYRRPFRAWANIDYSSLDQVPAIVRKGRSATVEALANSGVDRYDIPAFLRKQAD